MESKRFTLEELKDAFVSGLEIGYDEGCNYGHPEDDELFEEWFNAKFKNFF